MHFYIHFGRTPRSKLITTCLVFRNYRRARSLRCVRGNSRAGLSNAKARLARDLASMASN